MWNDIEGQQKSLIMADWMNNLDYAANVMSLSEPFWDEVIKMIRRKLKMFLFEPIVIDCNLKDQSRCSRYVLKETHRSHF